MSTLNAKDLCYQDKELEELVSKIKSMLIGETVEKCEEALMKARQEIKTTSLVS